VKSTLIAGSLFIDVDTACNLELVKDNITRKTANTLYGSSSHNERAHACRPFESLPDSDGVPNAASNDTPAVQQ
jgi:hypothetical protein